MVTTWALIAAAALMADGASMNRMWYASRKQPPFTDLYFALNTARWSGPLSASSVKRP